MVRWRSPDRLKFRCNHPNSMSCPLGCKQSQNQGLGPVERKQAWKAIYCKNKAQGSCKVYDGESLARPDARQCRAGPQHAQQGEAAKTALAAHSVLSPHGSCAVSKLAAMGA